VDKDGAEGGRGSEEGGRDGQVWAMREKYARPACTCRHRGGSRGAPSTMHESSFPRGVLPWGNQGGRGARCVRGGEAGGKGREMMIPRHPGRDGGLRGRGGSGLRANLRGLEAPETDALLAADGQAAAAVGLVLEAGDVALELVLDDRRQPSLCVHVVKGYVLAALVFVRPGKVALAQCQGEPVEVRVPADGLHGLRLQRCFPGAGLRRPCIDSHKRSQASLHTARHLRVLARTADAIGRDKSENEDAEREERTQERAAVRVDAKFIAQEQQAARHHKNRGAGLLAFAFRGRARWRLLPLSLHLDERVEDAPPAVVLEELALLRPGDLAIRSQFDVHCSPCRPEAGRQHETKRKERQVGVRRSGTGDASRASRNTQASGNSRNSESISAMVTERAIGGL